MDSPNAQHHHQEMSSQTLESMLVCTKAQQDKKPRPPEQALKCPRCDSTNTKFCYYNNYSLTQPRYFCKSCRRYWTKGGTLRNVPVGGGCRKNRRSSSSSSSSSSKKGQDPNPFQPNPNPLSSLSSMMPYDSDISLALARLQKHSMSGGGNLFDHDHQQQPIDHHQQQQQHMMQNPNQTNFFDALRGSGFVEGQNNGFQNLYYGGNNNMGHDQEMTSAMAGYDSYDREMSVKQEMCNASRADVMNGSDSSSKVLWGFPWQVNAGDVSNGGGLGGGDHHNLDSGRQQMMMSSSWNNGFGASWQGLLNSAPLM